MLTPPLLPQRECHPFLLLLLLLRPPSLCSLSRLPPPLLSLLSLPLFALFLSSPSLSLLSLVSLPLSALFALSRLSPSPSSPPSSSLPAAQTHRRQLPRLVARSPPVIGSDTPPGLVASFAEPRKKKPVFFSQPSSPPPLYLLVAGHHGNGEQRRLSLPFGEHSDDNQPINHPKIPSISQLTHKTEEVKVYLRLAGVAGHDLSFHG